MIRIILCHNQFDVINIDYDIFKTYCMPLFGSQLWDCGNTYRVFC